MAIGRNPHKEVLDSTQKTLQEQGAIAASPLAVLKDGKKPLEWIDTPHYKGPDRRAGDRRKTPEGSVFIERRGGEHHKELAELKETLRKTQEELKALKVGTTTIGEAITKQALSGKDVEETTYELGFWHLIFQIIKNLNQEIQKSLVWLSAIEERKTKKKRLLNRFKDQQNIEL